MSLALSTPQAFLYHRERECPDTPFLHQPSEHGTTVFTWGGCAAQARRLAAALRAMGFEPGDRIGIFSRNCAEWIIADLALMVGGYISVPIYSSASEHTTAHTLADSGAKAVFVGKLDHPEEQDRGIGREVVRIAMPYPTLNCHHQWQDLLDAHEPLTDSFEPNPDDVMTLLYTSGSTGKPKGAVHSYRNFMYAGEHIGAAMGLDADGRLLSYLPLAHCTERAYVEAASIVYQPQLWFVHSVEKFSDALVACQPTVFGSVPRLWKIFQLQILAKIPANRLALLLKIPLISALVKKRIRRQMGLSDSRWFMSGSAPIAGALLDWWQALDMPLSEGWGMTETFAYGTLLPLGGDIRRGTIGKACAGTTLRLTQAGELEIFTETLMSGYYNAPEKTAESFTEDGFFRTGDRAEIDSEGYVKITGRVKDIFKTAKGKYVAPVPIESRLGRNSHADLVCLVGSGLTQPVALVVLSESSRGLDQEALSQSLNATRLEVNASLESHEKIDHMLVVPEVWDTGNGLLTPTLKVRRHTVEKRYAEALASGHDKPVVFLLK
ncbi:MAG: AMP-binding protein [Lysobacterales bacterium]